MKRKASIEAKQSNYLPYYFFVLLAVLAGIADTLYLAYSHYRNFTDIEFSSFCAITKAINCDTVSQSPWSILFGIPVAFWGLFGYLLFFIILVTARKAIAGRLSLWSILFILGAVYSVAALYFGYVATTRIHAYCIMCIMSYGISFSLFFLAWMIRRRFDINSFATSLHIALHYFWQSSGLKAGTFILIIFFLCLRLFIPQYWAYNVAEMTADMPTGVTEDGHPWIGSVNPVLTIEEYSDYQCFQCNKMHVFLRNLISRNFESIRLVHHHYPMDHEFNPVVVPEPFHVGAGKMALLAIYATTQGKFWEMNDALFRLGRDKAPFNTRTLALETGIPSGELTAATSNPHIRQLLDNDIRRGMKLRIMGTPSFVIDGQVYQGSIPADILKKVLQ